MPTDRRPDTRAVSDSSGVPLPLRFVTPPGWPEPDALWVATMQGWEPQTAWSPAPGLPHVSAGHPLWTVDADRWPVEQKPFRQASGNRVFVAIAVLAVVAVMVLAQVSGRLEVPGWVNGVLLPALLAVGVLGLVIGTIERIRMDGTVRAAVTRRAASERSDRPAVPYGAGMPPFGAVPTGDGDVVAGPRVTHVSARVRRRSRALARGTGWSWLTVGLAAGVAVVAWTTSGMLVAPGAGDGPLGILRPSPSAAATQAAASGAGTSAGTRVTADGALVVRTTGASSVQCLTSCSSWTITARRVCAAPVAHVVFGRGTSSRVPEQVRSVDRRLGPLAAGSVTQFAEDRAAGERGVIDGIRCDGAPGPAVSATVHDVGNDALWAWTITPAGSCGAATISVERDEPTDDGATRIVVVAPLVAAVPLTIAVPRPAGAVTADLQPITC